MAKKFNIHDWQAKQRLSELDTPGSNPNYFYDDDFKKMKQKYDSTASGGVFDDEEKTRSQESMSNADIQALQKVVGDYSLNLVLNTIAAISDKIGKHDESHMIKNLASKIQDFPTDIDEKKGVPHYTKDGKEWTGPTHKMPNGPLMTQDPHNEDSEELFHKEDLDEQNMTGTGTSFNKGTGMGHFGKKNKKTK